MPLPVLSPELSRRAFVGLGAAFLAAPNLALAESRKDYVVPEEYLPIVVRTRGQFEPGQIIVDPDTFSLYLTMERRRAARFIVGIGRGNLYEPGSFYVGAKKEWPSWTPTKEMIARSPKKYGKYSGGMPGGPNNPLGARALYLFTEQKGDTFLRIHGTPEPWTIASAVSNGCVRLVNEHIVALYDLVDVGTPVTFYAKS